MSIKQAQKIEVGLHEGRPGFTVEYTDGERAHFVFHRDIARSLADGLHRIVNDLEYLDRQMTQLPGDRIGIADAANVRITPPSSGALGIGSGDGISVDD